MPDADVFIDTNVLVYAYDRAEPEKQARALEVLDRLARTGAGAVSAQVLAEFTVVVTSKLPAPLTLEEAYARVENFLRIWRLVDLTGMIVLEAIRGVREHRFNYWDAQIWAAARLNQIPLVLSEDFSDGAVVEGVRFVNPFGDGFDLAHWLR
ncbi:MAG: PIN domain-containing protein [Firmicutes bacterium]|nr:PIN domain-containing protein [Bacillota bacterium]